MAEDRGESLFNVREIGKMSMQMISSIATSQFLELMLTN